MLMVAGGLIVNARQAEAIIAEGRADLVAIGREMLLNPFWPAHAAKELSVDPEFKRMPVQYGWWLDRRRKTGYPG
jgi:2,4-dienoyl-CoA reductase-like NADH-dependent reductase (Old Yellow Enzyme family)